MACPGCILFERSGMLYPSLITDYIKVGNQAFANYVDAHLTLTHINNKWVEHSLHDRNSCSILELIPVREDPIPILPGRFLGYAHPSGEVHIMDSGSWFSCPGTQTHHMGLDCWFTKPIYVQAKIIPALNALLAMFRT